MIIMREISMQSDLILSWAGLLLALMVLTAVVLA